MWLFGDGSWHSKGADGWRSLQGVGNTLLASGLSFTVNHDILLFLQRCAFLYCLLSDLLGLSQVME